MSNGNTYAYNAAGSTVTRVIGADTYSLAYDSENRLKTVQKNGAVMAEFLYDGDGTRVQSTINGVTTKFVGEYYEVTDSVVTKYYGGFAMRKDGTLSYLLSDHLGSNSLILDTAGNVVGETRYTAWGEERYSSGSVSTDYTYTGQYSNIDDFGLMYYKARWYDPVLGRFAQADSIVPGAGNPVSWDRYAYVGNNPITYKDPSGHSPEIPLPDPLQLIRDAVKFFTDLGYTVVADPTVKSIYANGADLVVQLENESGQVVETIAVECKEVSKVTLGTLGKNFLGNYGGSVQRVLQTADRLAKTSNQQLQQEFTAIQNGQAAGNLRNALYTTAGKVSEGAKGIFNYVYTNAAAGAATAAKGVESFATSTLSCPFLVVPYYLLDPNNSPVQRYHPKVDM